ncbi:glycosyltransferase family 4 protein [Novosphingobium sp.]|uniref:glycosyltransferase family 4 protein n=1 Tax=Novosphingobium sp. TaxID=1874826 RepID=UPI003D09B795
MPARNVIINGKFLLGGSTGVHRVAGELTLQLLKMTRENRVLASQIAFELLIPPGARAGAEALGAPFRVVGPFDGRVWEQVTLPMIARDRMILSLCNVGVMAATNSVTMIHDAQVHITPDSYARSFRAWYRLQQGVIGRRHRRILTVSEYSRQQLIHFGVAPAGAIRVIHNGIDHIGKAPPEPAIVGRLGLQPGRFVVALANTQVHKNIAMLLRTFADPALADITLVLFGAHGADDFRAAGHVVPGNVCFAGRISDGELAALYGAARCMVFPSSTEGFGLPPLEAMRSGCPAIVANAGALPEVCGAAALYADPARPDHWVRAIVRLGEDRALRQTLIAAGHEQAARFTWRAAADRVVQELLAI